MTLSNIKGKILYRYLLRNNILNKFILNIYKERSYTTKDYSYASLVIEMFKFDDFRSILGTFEFNSFIWEDTEEGETFWHRHSQNFTREYAQFMKQLIPPTYL